MGKGRKKADAEQDATSPTTTKPEMKTKPKSKPKPKKEQTPEARKAAILKGWAKQGIYV
jgi:hypothetical protein